MRLILAVVFAALILSPGEPSPAAGDHDRARAAVRAGEVLSLERILSTVRRQFPGRVLDAGLFRRGPDRRWLYRVKILRPNGNVMFILVDGRSGAIVTTR